MEFTGERLVPGAVDIELETEHRLRYKFAAQLVQGKRVLDAACGIKPFGIIGRIEAMKTMKAGYLEFMSLFAFFVFFVLLDDGSTLSRLPDSNLPERNTTAFALT